MCAVRWYSASVCKFSRVAVANPRSRPVTPMRRPEEELSADAIAARRAGRSSRFPRDGDLHIEEGSAYAVSTASTISVPCAGEAGAVHKRAVVGKTTGGVPAPAETILGTTLVGTRILLRDGGRGRRGDDQGVHRESEVGRGRSRVQDHRAHRALSRLSAGKTFRRLRRSPDFQSQSNPPPLGGGYSAGFDAVLNAASALIHCPLASSSVGMGADFRET